MVKNLCILGSTGSIGTQTLDVVRAYPDRYSVYALCAHRSIDKLVEQAREFHPEVVCIADESLYEELSRQLSAISYQGKVWAGANSIAEVVTMPSINVVVAAMVGYAGLRPTIEAIKAGKMTATVKQDGDAMGEANIRFMMNYLINGSFYEGLEDKYKLNEDGVSVFIPYAKITLDSIE